MRARACIAAALLILAAIAFGPFRSAGSFAAHMAAHMAIAVGVAPLLALGLAGGRLDPVRRAPRIFAPIPASMAELLIVWGWHAPGAHRFARESVAGWIAEQASFFAAAFAVWMASFGGQALRGGRRAAAGVLALLLTFVHMVLLGVLLALPPRPLYAHGHDVQNALADQHLGGAIMLAGSASYLVGGLLLGAALLRAPSRTVR